MRCDVVSFLNLFHAPNSAAAAGDDSWQPVQGESMLASRVNLHALSLSAGRSIVRTHRHINTAHLFLRRR